MRVIVLGPEPDRVCVDGRPVADPEQRELVAARMPSIGRRHRKRLCALLLGVSRTARVVDAGDDGDAVSLGDSLTEAS